MSITKKCAAYSLLELLGKRWTLLILHELCGNSKGFNQLLRDVEGINPRVLSTRMRDLVRHGLARKELHTTKPVTVSYSLTKKGESLKAIMKALEDVATSTDYAKVDLEKS